MADTTTTNYVMVKPEVGASNDSWGTKTNGNWDIADVRLKVTFDLANAAMPKAGGAFTAGITGTSAGFSGAVSGASGAFTGAVTGATGTFSGALSSASIASTGAITQGGSQVWHAGNLDPSLKANLASPALTGTPIAPTATGGTNTTQLATTAFVRSEVAALVAGSPGALDTLNELAAALGNDPSFAATIATALGGKQASLGFTPANKAGDTFSAAFGRDAGFTLDITSGNPRLNFDTGDYIQYDRTANKLTLVIGSTAIFSIDSSGNVKTKGDFAGGQTSV